MKKNNHNQDWVWEFLNSRWTMVSVLSLGILSFMSFIYIGFKVKCTKWKVYGVIYAVALFGLGFNDILDWIFKFIIFSSTIHAVSIRKKYLLTLEALQNQ